MSKGPGRPSLYTDEIASEVCERLMKGESLRSICRDDHMPHEATVRTWALDDREGFYTRYTRARTIQAHQLFDETLDIADDAGADTQRSRLRVDTRKWYLSKVLPKVYGKRQKIEHSGEIKGGETHIYLPDNDREDLPDQLRQRDKALTNGAGD